MLYYKIYSDEKNKLSYEKPVIVLIHGFAGNMGIFAKQIAPLKKKYDLILVDLPSHGQTTEQLSDSEISFSAISYEIAHILDDLKVEKAHFIGCSVGVMFVKYFLTYFYERVDKSIMIGGVGEYLPCYKSAIRWGKFLLHFLPCQLACQFISKVVMPDKISKDVRKWFLLCCKKIPKKEFFAWMTLFTRFPQLNKQYLKRIKSNQINTDKVLYISGELDLLFLPTVKKEMKQFSNSYILSNCGHICNYDKPKETNDLIKLFLARKEG